MANPKKKTTKSKKGMRQWKEKKTPPTLVECPHCHHLILPHHVCPYCGYYDGRQVIAVEKKKKEKEKAA
ncbi:MAG: 50S ribosomal protein L32 [Caldisericaceae bacterium]|nr:50S ribosomal protein L32 [Caldisericaceae bacterium]